MISLHFYFVSLLSTYMCTTSMQFLRNRKRALDFLELELLMGVSHSVGAVIEPKSSVRVARALLWAISLGPINVGFKDAFFFLRNIPMNTIFSRSFQMALTRILSRSRIQQLYLLCHSLYIYIISLCNVMNHIKREWVQKGTVTSQEWDQDANLSRF